MKNNNNNNNNMTSYYEEVIPHNEQARNKLKALDKEYYSFYHNFLCEFFDARRLGTSNIVDIGIHMMEEEYMKVLREDCGLPTLRRNMQFYHTTIVFPEHYTDGYRKRLLTSRVDEECHFEDFRTYADYK